MPGLQQLPPRLAALFALWGHEYWATENRGSRSAVRSVWGGGGGAGHSVCTAARSLLEPIFYSPWGESLPSAPRIGALPTMAPFSEKVITRGARVRR